MKRQFVWRSLVAGLCLAALSTAAQAVGVTYSETQNNGSRVVTSSSGVTFSMVANPYLNGNVQPYGAGWIVTFTPSADFTANADYSLDRRSDVFDGKVDFKLIFDSPVNFHITLTEGGTWGSNNGGHFLLAGGVVHESNNPVPISGSTALLPVFNNDGTWSATTEFTDFAGAFSTYSFSVDNLLDAEAPFVGSSAFLTKNYITITVVPVPLPPAFLSGAAFGVAALLVRGGLKLRARRNS